MLFEENRAAFEEYVGFYFRAFLKEADGMLELEVVVVVVGLRPETDFFYDYLGCFGFDFLGFLLLLIEIFLIVKDFAYRGLCVWRYFHEVEVELVGNAACLLNGIYAGGDVVAYKTHFACTYVLVYVVGRLLLLAWVTASGLLWARTVVYGSGCSRIVRFFIHSVCLVAV